MIGKIMKAASFRGCVQYVTGKEAATILASDGVLLGSVESITESFEYQRQMNTRISKPVGHIALSFKPEDKGKLTDEMMTKIALEYMEMMGIKDTHSFSLSATTIMTILTVIWYIIASTITARPSLTRTTLGEMKGSRNSLKTSTD